MYCRDRALIAKMGGVGGDGEWWWWWWLQKRQKNEALLK
jgi:hypothetical protein